MPKLRILHIYQSPSFSGAEGYALELAENHASKFETCFLVQKNSPLEKRIAESVFNLRIATSFDDVDFLKFDVVILHSTQELKHHWPRLAFAKLRAAVTKSYAPRVVLYTHIWISHSKKDPLHAIPYAVVDQVWTSSEQARAALTRFLPVPKDRIELVRYGRHLRAFASSLLSRTDARLRLELPFDATVVGTIARVDKGKGSRELFDGVTDLMQLRADLHLVMIGPATSGDPKAADLDEEIDRDIAKLAEPIRRRVHKMGRVENATTLMRAFDLFILATYKENFALTLLEAALAEVPCLATDSGGSPDVVHPHATGWLYRPESVKALRETLLTALEEKNKWNKFGERGRKFVTENFDFDRVMTMVDDKLAKLASKSLTKR